MSDPLQEMREMIQETAVAEIPAFQRSARLRAMRDELKVAVEEAEGALTAVEAARDDERAGLQVAISALRDRATLSESLIADGVATEQEIAESGVLSNSDLDELDEEGLLEATVQELIDRGALSIAGEWSEPVA